MSDKRKFLEEIYSLVAKHKSEAGRFNFFEMLRVTSDEKKHSRALSYLLDPAEDHGQGDLFLRAFPEKLNERKRKTALPVPLPDDLNDTKVTPEYYLGEDGIADLVIFLSGEHIILIENKVKAKEGQGQIGRYKKWLKKRLKDRRTKDRRAFLVFLTPTGREPESPNDNDKDVICLSYADLSNWLHLLPGVSQLPERLRIVLDQYIESCEACRFINTSRWRPPSMRNKELQEWVKKDLRKALDTNDGLTTAVEKIRAEAFQAFGDRVKAELKEKLKVSGHKEYWRVHLDDDIFVKDAALSILWRKPCTKDNPQFAIVFENLTSNPDGDNPSYGIIRGHLNEEAKKTFQPDIRDQKLLEKLKGDGYKIVEEAGNWVGWKTLKQFDRKTALINVFEDNNSSENPLSKDLIDRLWKLFEDHRAALEDLNKNYPYSGQVEEN